MNRTELINTRDTPKSREYKLEFIFFFSKTKITLLFLVNNRVIIIAKTLMNKINNLTVLFRELYEIQLEELN